MKKCRKCSSKMHRELAICDKCAMPALVEPENNHFPKPSEFIDQLKEAKLKKIQDTKPIPLFDDDDSIKSLKMEDAYADTEVDLLSSPKKEKSSKANKTICIPLFADKPRGKSKTARLQMIDELEDEESEELIISDLDLDDVEDLEYEPEIVGVAAQQPSEDTTEMIHNESSIDIDHEYMPLPGEEKEEEQKQEQPKSKYSENNQTQKISRLEKNKLKVEYVSEYPDSWEWVLFETDTENRFGYQISGREKVKGVLEFLIFPDEDISADVMSKITDQQRNELRDLIKNGQIMESIRNLRKNFKALRFRQAWEVVRSFARQEKCRVNNLSMIIDELPAKDRKVILRILRQGKTLEAIYLFRSMTKLGLKESREQIEYLCEKEKLAYDPLNVSTEHLVIKKSSVDSITIIIRLLILTLITLIIWIIFF